MFLRSSMQKADVRQYQIDAGQLLLGRKRHAAIDDEPLPAAPVAKTVNREIHPDFADAAERREDQFVCRHRLIPAGRERFGAAPIEREHVACRYFFDAAAGELEDEPAGRVEADKAAALFAAAVTDDDSSPIPRAAASQSSRIAGSPRRTPLLRRRHIVAESL